MKPDFLCVLCFVAAIFVILCGVEDREEGGWSGGLVDGRRDEEIEDLRRHTRTGRTSGSPGFVGRLESLLGRTLRPGKPGRRPKEKGQKPLPVPRY